MDNITKTLKELSKKANEILNKYSLVGLDGFVDKIVTPVGERYGPGDQFHPIPSIDKLGDRIKAAAGMSTNIELYPKVDKLGGNGPIMANALLAMGQKVKYIGALGDKHIHPVFEKFSKMTDAVSLTSPGITHAVEFPDGKIMFGSMASLDEITYSKIIEKMGEGQFIDTLSRADLIALVNWTMIPHMTAILNEIVEKVLPNLGPHPNRIFFFDLADPEKRSATDLGAVLNTFKDYQNFGNVVLGLNLKEAQAVYNVLDFKDTKKVNPEYLKQMASDIRAKLNLSIVVIHPIDAAVCATKEDSFYVKGPFTAQPVITTGAGDHFNSGFVTGYLLEMPPECCLTLGVANSGFYVRNGKSPSLTDISSFISSW